MLFKELYIKNNKRLLLNNITEVTYVPEQIIQIIVGTNGSGKTSLLRELTPLPSNMKTDYFDNGLRRITIIKDNATYVITDEKHMTPKYSFIVNGTELNKGRTRQIQLGLVKEHFNLTPAIHNVLVGIDTFTNMSVSSRKEWFTAISNINYEFALNVFKELKEKYRDIVGGIKTYQSKLSSINNDILTEDDKNILLVKIEHINKYIQYLTNNKAHITDIKDINMDTLNTLSNSIFTTIEIIKNRHNDLLKKVDLNNIDNIITETKTVLRLSNTSKDHLEKEINKLSNDINKISKLDSTDISELLNNSNELNNVIDVLQEKLHVPDILLNNAIDLVDTYEKLYPTLINYLTELEHIGIKSINQNTILNLKQDINEVTSKINNINNKLNTINLKIGEQETISKNDETECPNCSYKWILGYDHALLGRLKLSRDKLSSELNVLNSELANLENNLDKNTECVNYLEYIKQIIDNTPALSLLWEYIRKNYTLLLDLTNIKNMLYKFKIDISTHIDINKNNLELIEIKNQIELLKQQSIREIETLKSNYRSLEHKYNEIVDEVNTSKTSLTILTEYKNRLLQLEDLHNQLKVLLKQKNKHNDATVMKLRNEVINKLIIELNVEKSSIENLIMENNSKLTSVEMLIKDIDTLKQKERILKLLVNEMSPTDGLIADSIVLFITQFMNKLNIIINDVWSYALLVKPCKISDDGKIDLDFKFPVEINESPVSNDIKETSSAQSEIINLAFKLVSMEYLGLTNAPLYLDEFGHSMDDHHRIQAYNSITDLIKDNFSQVFMISHFESCYGLFKSSNIISLSTDNINISEDKKINEVIELN